ncbi:hypothetical protein SAMN05444166_7077 [Singulisphaera sp. GP187]|uniref:hypothetical protein n=1 Tax=Singulisphaera sp. GP187 TaxID=1882752 RepID=UPI00092913EF|nr:hypothetical protein [Singulisphaera sp. GP187]SIO62543.1 hypothetical protein SAMN05444166_7077 [Singulisphaera sp. GP187]
MHRLYVNHSTRRLIVAVLPLFVLYFCLSDGTAAEWVPGANPQDLPHLPTLKAETAVTSPFVPLEAGKGRSPATLSD